MKSRPIQNHLLLPGGINYHVGNSAFASIGYVHVTNYSYDKALLPGVHVSKNRLWQQCFMRNTLEEFSLISYTALTARHPTDHQK